MDKEPAADASLRAHSLPVTAVGFDSKGLSLVSGDESGWVIVWSLVSRRPVVVFKPHQKAVVKVEFVGDTSRVLTHGRDNKLYLWEVNETLDTELPMRNSDPANWRNPWMVHSQDVNALNFCGAAVCGNGVTLNIAVPSTVNSSRIDLYGLTEGQLTRPIQALECSLGDDKVGIMMALQLTPEYICAAFESGHVVVFDRDTSKQVFIEKFHKQPVMSLTVLNNTLVSTAADSLIVKLNLDNFQFSHYNTQHSGLGWVAIRDDSKILATAGWDGMVRVFRLDGFKPLAAFAGGRQDGVTAVAFAPLIRTETTSGSSALARRQAAVQHKHYLAVAGKDGRIALYNIY